MRRITTWVALLVLALPAVAQQQQPFEEQIDVNAVLIDAVVTDASGHQILGLTKDDFVVKENGVEQQIDSVDYRTNLRLLDAREDSAPFKVERINEGRYFVLFFDKPEDIAAGFGKMALARKAAREFIRNEIGAGDRVAIVGHDVRLKIYSDFTDDRRQLERALDEVQLMGGGLTKAPAGDAPSLLRGLNMGEVMIESGRLYRALDYLGDALRPIRGRKNVILFSHGIRDVEESVSGGILLTRSRFFDPMLESLNAANVTVYGLQMQEDPSLTPVIHQRLEEIAAGTGGDYYRFNTNFTPSLKRIEDKNNGYYLITYRSRKAEGERGFQKVDVSVKQPGLRITARSGYQYGG
jgi:VWFA-related protein